MRGERRIVEGVEVEETVAPGGCSVCPNCGSHFSASGKKKWCSRKCRDAYQHRARRRLAKCSNDEDRNILRKEFYEKRVVIERLIPIRKRHVPVRNRYPILFKEESLKTEERGPVLEIPITGQRGGVVAIVDDTSKNRELLGRTFTNDHYGYPVTSLNGKSVHLHHLVLGFPPKGFVVDHINHDKLDARLSNLRFIRRGENNYNTGVRADNSTGVTGVYYESKPRSGRPFWYARIGKNGKDYHLGNYFSFEEAVAARKEAEIALYGYCLPCHIKGLGEGGSTKSSNTRIVSRTFNRSRKQNSRRRGSRRIKSSWGV